MVCPVCQTGDEVQKLLTKDTYGYSACVICLTCMRQVRVVREDPSEAIDEACSQFAGEN